jgi:hypothetical protein
MILLLKNAHTQELMRATGVYENKKAVPACGLRTAFVVDLLGYSYDTASRPRSARHIHIMHICIMVCGVAFWQAI